MAILVYHFDISENQTWVGRYRYAGFLKFSRAASLFPADTVVASGSIAHRRAEKLGSNTEVTS